MAVLLGCVVLMLALVLPALRANAADGNVCPPGDSGKIDVPGDQTSVTVTAPAGYLISGYCVKAGSVQGGTGGPVFVVVDPPTKSVTITYPGGKAVSHYSVTYVPVTPPTTPPPSTTTKPPTSTTTTQTTTTTTHTTGTHTSPSSSTTSSSGAVSTVTTYPLQPVDAGATSDPVAPRGVTPLQGLLLLIGLLGMSALLVSATVPAAAAVPADRFAERVIGEAPSPARPASPATLGGYGSA